MDTITAVNVVNKFLERVDLKGSEAITLVQARERLVAVAREEQARAQTTHDTQGDQGDGEE